MNKELLLSIIFYSIWFGSALIGEILFIKSTFLYDEKLEDVELVYIILGIPLCLISLLTGVIAFFIGFSIWGMIKLDGIKLKDLFNKKIKRKE